MCLHCLSDKQIGELKDAALEHFNKNDWRRVIPKPFKVRVEN